MTDESDPHTSRKRGPGTAKSRPYEVPGGIAVLLVVAITGAVGIIAIAAADAVKYSACVEHHAPAECKVTK